MHTIQRIVKNTVALFGAQLVNSILALVLSILIARTLGDVTFGKYSFAIVFTAILATFSNLGYDIFIVREVAKDKSRAYKYLSNMMTMRAFLSFILFTPLLLFVNVMDISQDTKNVIYLFAGYVLLTSFAGIFKMIFRAFEKMEYDAFTRILVNVLKTSLGILILFLGYGLIGLGFVFLFAGVFDVLFTFFICRKKFVNPGMDADINFWKNTIKIAIPLGMADIFVLIYTKIDIVMLSIMKGDAVVGWYNAAYNLTISLQAIPNLFMHALFPLMAVYSISARNSIKVVYEKSFRYLFILGVPLAIGTTFLADKIIFFFYGQQFSNSILALQILSWDILLLFLNRCLFYSLITVNKQNQITKIAGICVLINVCLNLILIPEYSYVGAGIATIITELILFSLFFYVASKNICLLRLHKIMIKPIIASALMGILICILSNINFALVIFLSAIFYLMILYLIKDITREDITMLKNMLGRNIE